MGEMEEFQKNLELRDKLRAAALKEREAGDALFEKTAANDAEQIARKAIAEGGNRQKVLDAIQSEIKNTQEMETMWKASLKSSQKQVGIAKSERDPEKVDRAVNTVNGDKSSLDQATTTLTKLRALEKHYKDEIAEGKGSFTKSEIDYAKKRTTEIEKSDKADMDKAGEHYKRYHRATEKAVELEKELGMDATDPITTAALDPSTDDGTAVAMAAGAGDASVASLMSDPDDLDSISVDGEATDADATAVAAVDPIDDPDALDVVSIGAGTSPLGEPTLSTVEPQAPAILEELEQGTATSSAPTEVLEPEIDIASGVDLETEASGPAVITEEAALEPAVAAVEPTDASPEDAETQTVDQMADVVEG
jgi:hypothetical protein